MGTALRQRQRRCEQSKVLTHLTGTSRPSAYNACVELHTMCPSTRCLYRHDQDERGRPRRTILREATCVVSLVNAKLSNVCYSHNPQCPRAMTYTNPFAKKRRSAERPSTKTRWRPDPCGAIIRQARLLNMRHAEKIIPCITTHCDTQRSTKKQGLQHRTTHDRTLT